ncbi:MAG: MFS transporter [Chloroflexota bacterium]
MSTSIGRSFRLYFSGLGGLGRNAWLFLTVTAFRGLCIASLQTVLNLYLYSRGYDARFIGLINGANSIAILVVSVPAGYLADRIGRRPVLLLGGILYPLSILGVGLASSTAGIILFNFLFGVFAVSYWVAGVPLLYASTPQTQRVQAFSINSFLLYGLGPVGAFLSGQAVEIAARAQGISASSTNALRYGIYFMAAMGAVGAIPYLFLREPHSEKAAAREKPPAGHVARLFTKLLVPDLVLAFGMGSILTFAQLYFHLSFNLDPGPVGIVMGIGGVFAGVATLITPFFAARWGNLKTAVLFGWLAAPFMAVMALSHLLGIGVAAYWLVVMFRGMSDPVYTAFIQESVPEAYRARLTGLYSVTYSLGSSLGPAASGQLQKEGGFAPAFLMASAFYFAGATLLYTFFGRRRARDEGKAIAAS